MVASKVLGAEAAVNVPQSRRARTRSVSTHVGWVSVEQLKIVRWPITRPDALMSLDVNVAADATVYQDSLAKTVNVSKIRTLTLQFAIHLKEIASNNAPSILTVQKTSTATDSSDNVYLCVLASAATTLSVALSITTQSAPASKDLMETPMLVAPSTNHLPTHVFLLLVVQMQFANWTMETLSAPVQEGRQATPL